ncbi:specific cyclin-D1-like protein [Blastocystis sp. subtype 4]|uniref:specific cyclin-D1-like protein n=1 Tax=Blastocystis sp. subtype 4 TaxID=944170 RepID=UPI0007120398|nr:specific cyclin-D1-like protein [Blastocystis sp. subtype 4]KNB43213.1 specific cyclin-D1-like protein [Blastocystis sp. subtype 4]|eukprot:XP_014526656.1 specific cyclin-D1-like protein [Blastocystis sp. subtype 4]
MFHILRSTESLAEPARIASTGTVFLFSDFPCSVCSPRSDVSYSPNPDYAIHVQELKRFEGYREQTYNWMLQICCECNLCLSVAFVGMNYFDRFLSSVVINRSKVELLSWACLFLASSVFSNQSHMLSLRQITVAIRDTYTSNDLLAMIYEVLSVLCFRLLPLSPYELGDELLCSHFELLLSYRTLVNHVCSSLGE